MQEPNGRPRATTEIVVVSEKECNRSYFYRRHERKRPLPRLERVQLPEHCPRDVDQDGGAHAVVFQEAAELRELRHEDVCIHDDGDCAPAAAVDGGLDRILRGGFNCTRPLESTCSRQHNSTTNNYLSQDLFCVYRTFKRSRLFAAVEELPHQPRVHGVPVHRFCLVLGSLPLCRRVYERGAQLRRMLMELKSTSVKFELRSK